MKTLNFYVNKGFNRGFRSIKINGNKVIVEKDTLTFEALVLLSKRVMEQYDIKLSYKGNGRDTCIHNSFNGEWANVREVDDYVHSLFKSRSWFSEIPADFTLTVEEFLALAYRDTEVYCNTKLYEEPRARKATRECSWADRQSAMMNFNSLAGDKNYGWL